MVTDSTGGAPIKLAKNRAKMSVRCRHIKEKLELTYKLLYNMHHTCCLVLLHTPKLQCIDVECPLLTDHVLLKREEKCPVVLVLLKKCAIRYHLVFALVRNGTEREEHFVNRPVISFSLPNNFCVSDVRTGQNRVIWDSLASLGARPFGCRLIHDPPHIRCYVLINVRIIFVNSVVGNGCQRLDELS